MEKINEELIFIIGFPRSGTTLSANILNKHSQISMPPETHFFSKYSKRTSFPVPKAQLEKEIARMVSFNRIKDLQVTPEEILPLLDSSKDVSQKDLLKALLYAYAQKSGKTILGEKTPVHMLHVDEIISLFPKAKLIFIVRDGRDCVNSLLNTPWHHNNYIRHAAEWTSRMNILETIKSKHPKNLYCLKFEDLILDSERALKDLFDFLQVPFEAQMLEQGSGNSAIVPEWEKKWKDKVNQSMDKSRVFSWKTEKNEFKLSVMNALMGKNLLKWGYEVNPVKLNFSSSFKRFFILVAYNSFNYGILVNFRKLIKK